LILLTAILAGMAGGWLIARWQQRTWTLPPLKGVWLVLVGFLPQFIAFYLPATRTRIPDTWASAGLISSQILLLFFCWLNRRLSGIWLMALGLLLNLVVIAANNGFMPISPQTASRVASQEAVASMSLGSRAGSSKDILLEPSMTRFEWLADRFVTPKGIPYRAAFSLGDIVIAAGAFWLLASQGNQLSFKQRIQQEVECYRPRRTNPPSL
jgi:hypothetical protein